MRLLGYHSPLLLNSASFWPEIKPLPHLCISQTLAQGLRKHYDRTSFSWIGTVQGALDEFWPEWENNPTIEIEQFHYLSDCIATTPSPLLRSSLKRSQRELLETIRNLLTISDLSPADLTDPQSPEEEFILTVWRKIKNDDAASCWSMWTFMDKRGPQELNDVFRTLTRKEIQEYLSQPSETSDDVLRELLKKKANSFTAEENIANHYASLLKITDWIDTKRNPRIVLHGIHQFTPVIWRFVEALERMGVEPIFLVNYQMAYPAVYTTWQAVYRAALHREPETLFDVVEDKPVKLGHSFGRALGALLEGKDPSELLKIAKRPVFKSYPHLSSFVASVEHDYRIAIAESNGTESESKNLLSLMPRQYYGVRGEAANEQLRLIFPQQFGERAFLAYPLGSFILSLYRMYDPKSQHLQYNESDLRECLAFALWSKPGDTSSLVQFNKLRLFFRGAVSISDCRERLANLIISLPIAEGKGIKAQFLRRFSFFTLSKNELGAFDSILEELESIAAVIFASDDDERVDYRTHFELLLEQILRRAGEREVADSVDLKLATEIQKRLSQADNLAIRGRISDLIEALHFYLARRKTLERHAASWIVRNFEQIDGGIFFDAKDDSIFHYAMLSDRSMGGERRRGFWPLSENSLNRLRSVSVGLNLVVTAQREYRNFLRFALFYGVFYLKETSVLEISYIREMDDSNGEEEDPYFLLTLLGIEAVDDDAAEIKGCSENESLAEEPIGGMVFGYKEQEQFSVCPARYFYGCLLDEIYYENEYHCTRNLVNMIFFLVKEIGGNQPIADLHKITQKIIDQICPLFPYLYDFQMKDIADWAKRNIVQDMGAGATTIRPLENTTWAEDYLRRKLTCLVAKVVDQDKTPFGMSELFKRIKPMDGFEAWRDIKAEELPIPVTDAFCEYCHVADICMKNKLGS